MKAILKRKLSNIDLLIITVSSSNLQLPKEIDSFTEMFDIAVKSKQFDGKIGSEVMLYGNSDIRHLLVLGIGDKKEIELESYRKAGGNAGKWSKKINCSDPVVYIDETAKHLSEESITQAISEAIIMGSYEFTALKTDKTQFEFSSISFFASKKSIEDAIQNGIILGNAVNDARDLCLLPGNHLTPTVLAAKSEQMANAYGLKCTILSEKDMKKEGMNSLLSVSRGSDEEAKLIVLEHKPKEYDETICFVGKGLTFDAGGISIKPAANMHEMKMDMSGGAAVYSTMKAVAEMNLPIHVVGLIPSSENLINGLALKPGDVVTSKSGKTIEVLNTDAEGRLILCDTLTYAERFDPDAVIDIATLTGAVIIGLGSHVTGMVGNNEALINELSEAGELTYERVWELPLYEEYKNQLKSEVADLANIGGRPAGTITAGAFLSHFAENYHWAHLDIAGTAWADGKVSYSPKGNTGIGVRLFIQFLKNRLK